MKTSFLNFSKEEQKKYFQAAAKHLDMSDIVIEKDFWVCWLLEQLFNLPQPMVFKGGTSLSKAYQLIERFSEDVDITLDYRNFHDEINFKDISRSQLKKLSDNLKVELKKHIESVVVSHLNGCIREISGTDCFKLTLSEDGEQLRFYYTSVIEFDKTYLRDHVLIEFGMRNSTEPFEKRVITPYLVSVLDSNSLPSPVVDTLSAVRTFWEKATLIHVECHRGRFSQSLERLARHWYDLYRLSISPIGVKAEKDMAVFKSVITFKRAFFNASYANYDACLEGNLLLIPSTENIKLLEEDFKHMVRAEMFYKKPPPFPEIIDVLKKLEARINHHTKENLHKES